jgi:hypothetical protein
LFFSYAKDQELGETVRLLEEFISDSQHRLALDDPDYHSFDEEEDMHWNQNGTLKKCAEPS